jgi:hypothetical protein
LTATATATTATSVDDSRNGLHHQGRTILDEKALIPIRDRFAAAQAIGSQRLLCSVAVAVKVHVNDAN